MSIQNAQDFITRANHDAAIRKLASERFGEIENVGREYGFEFERDEFDQAMRERKAAGGPTGSETACQCGYTDDAPPTGIACQCGKEDDIQKTTCECGYAEPADDPSPTTCECGYTDDPNPTTCECGYTEPGGPTGVACQCGDEGEGTGTACTGTACQCGTY